MLLTWFRPPLQLGVVAIEKEAFWSPSTKVANFTYLLKQPCIPTPKAFNGSTSSLPLLPGQLLPRVIVSVWVPSVGQIDLFENDQHWIRICETI